MEDKVTRICPAPDHNPGVMAPQEAGGSAAVTVVVIDIAAASFFGRRNSGFENLRVRGKLVVDQFP